METTTTFTNDLIDYCARVHAIYVRFEIGEIDSAEASYEVCSLDRPALDGHSLREHYAPILELIDAGHALHSLLVTAAIKRIVPVERMVYESYLLFVGSRRDGYPYSRHVADALGERDSLRARKAGLFCL